MTEHVQFNGLHGIHGKYLLNAQFIPKKSICKKINEKKLKKELQFLAFLFLPLSHLVDMNSSTQKFKKL